MNYLYHMVPKDMKGSVLYPLNILKKKYPLLYKEKVKKYQNRKYLLKQKIPILNCLWNDVLHLTAVHPSKIKRELKNAKIEVSEKSFFKINPKDLEKSKLIVYLFKDDIKKDYTNFNIKNLSKYNKINIMTKNYYREQKSKEERPLLFKNIPHILYKGNINTKNCKIIKW